MLGYDSDVTLANSDHNDKNISINSFNVNMIWVKLT